MQWRHRRNRFRGRTSLPVHSSPDPFEYRKEDVDEMLELVYMLAESGGKIRIEELKAKYEEEADFDKLLVEMASTGLLKVDLATVSLSDQGKTEAEKLIRAHRLAERLLTDVLLIDQDHELESQACKLEHILNPGVVDNICTILGHPRTCPHGLAIPPGPCCRNRTRRAMPAVFSLDQLRSGESGRILYVETTDHDRLDRLTAFGMLPGTIVRVHQRQPSLVVIMGETQLAIDWEIAEHIHVVKMN